MMSDHVGQVWELTIEHRSGMFLVVSVDPKTKFLQLLHLEEGGLSNLAADDLVDMDVNDDHSQSFRGTWRRIS